jgi:putative transposase
MARPLRIQYAGAFYHITSRGNERRPIFSGIQDHQKLFSFFSEAVVRYGLSIHAYCLMDNHYHLLLETSEPNLSQALHYINGGYTSYYNRAYGRSGHLFQGRYRAILVEKDAYATTLSRYIHLNPFRASLCKKPEEYPWSSYFGYIRMGGRPSWLETSFILGYFGPQETEAIRRYVRFVEGGMKDEIEDPLKGAVSGVVLGSDGFVDWVKKSMVAGVRETRDLPAARKLRPRPSVQQIKETLEGGLGKDYLWLRDISLLLCHRYTGKTLKGIGESHGGMEVSAVSQAIRRLYQRIAADRELERDISKIEKEVMKLSTV